MTAQLPSPALAHALPGPVMEVGIDGSVARLTVGDGSRHNVLGVSGWQRLRQLAEDLSGADTIKLVVVRGAGSTFTAGSDISDWQGASPGEVNATFEVMEAALQAVERIPVPTLAVVEGVAAGAGCQLALACDMRILAATARLGMPILRLGILPSPMFALRLAVLAGPARARELLYTGRLIDAATAERYGLASAVVDHGNLELEVAALIDTIVRQPRTGLVNSKIATGVEQARLRDQHRRPDWQFSDPHEFPARTRSFLTRRRGARER